MGREGPEKKKKAGSLEMASQRPWCLPWPCRTERSEMSRKSRRDLRRCTSPVCRPRKHRLSCVGSFLLTEAQQQLPCDRGCVLRLPVSPALEGSFRPCPAVVEGPPWLSALCLQNQALFLLWGRATYNEGAHSQAQGRGGRLKTQFPGFSTLRHPV